MRKDLMTNSSELDTKGYDLSYPPLTYTEIYFVVYTKTNEMYLMEMENYCDGKTFCHLFFRDGRDLLCFLKTDIVLDVWRKTA